MSKWGEYTIAEPENLETPAMVVFENQLEHNINTQCQMVGGGENLMVHVKTHKSADVTRRQIEAGVAGFKCATIKELEMVLMAGSQRAIMAYPLAQRRKAERLCALLAEHREAWVAAIVSTPFHVKLLEGAAASAKQRLRVMLDLDVGLHRTGISLGPEATDLYRSIEAAEHLEPAGFHVYDGHEHMADEPGRQAAAQVHIEAVSAFAESCKADGLPVPCIVGGSTFSYPYYARTEGMYGSPGTCIYWDTGYAGAMPDAPYNCAAMVLTQVVDRHPEQQTFTTDLGIKAISDDMPLENRVHLLGAEEAQLLRQNEEHGVFGTAAELPEVGTYLLAVPGHVCPTTVRYPGSYIIDGEGEVVDFYPHTARDRH